MYVENGDAVSLSRAKGKIVMVNGRVSGDVYQRLVSARLLVFISVEVLRWMEKSGQGSLSAQPADDLFGDAAERDRSCRSLQRIFTRCRRNIVAGFRANLHYKDAVELVTEGAAVVA